MARISASSSAAELTSHNLLSSKRVSALSIIERTTRFGSFPALRIGRFSVVGGFSKWKLGFCCPKGVETKTGLCDLFALNLGKWMFVYERPRQSFPSVFC